MAVSWRHSARLETAKGVGKGANITFPQVGCLPQLFDDKYRLLAHLVMNLRAAQDAGNFLGNWVMFVQRRN